MRSDAGDTAIQNDIQLYALGVGDVYEEAQLADTVRSTGGAYYQTEDLSGLQEQLVNLVSDLRGQYRLSYTTLRREGSYVTRVQVDLPWATGSFETVPLDVGSFYGLDTQGRIAIDPPSVIKSKAQADVFVRAIRVPRNISRFRVRADTAKPLTVQLVPREDGGLLDGWDLFGPDKRGFYQAFSDTPLEFGESGLLFHFTVSSVTEQRLDIPFIVDNAIYTGGKSFAYPASIFIGQRIDPTGHIAFRTTRDGASEIYVMNFDGSNQQNISNTKYTEFVASWSPDGAQLAFDSDRTFRREIYVMDGDGSKVVQLTSGTTTNELPAWSPDGRPIAFDSSEERDGDREIYVMNVDGSDRRRLTDNTSDDWWPAWSPDGAMIAFTSNRDGNAEVYVMNADGSNQRNISDHPAGDYRPVWSPDREQIAFYSLRDANREIYLMKADGTGQRNLTANLADDWYPTWSPQGAHIAFTSFRDGNREVYTMFSDGTDQRNVSNNSADDWAPAWGP